MFSRVTLVCSPQCIQVRGMATLKDIRVRLQSVKNIQKITQSMKMVSASKFARAERELKPARPYGQGVSAFYEKAEVKQDEKQPNHLIIAVTSDRGLCGAVHSGIVRSIKAKLEKQEEGTDTKLVAIGDKSRIMLQRLYSKNMLMHFNEIGKQPPIFADAVKVAQNVLESGYKFEFGEIYFNIFKSVVSYKVTRMPVFSVDSVLQADKLNIYDSLDEDVIRCYNEFAFASQIYYAMKEGATSEQSSRMTAMGAATKNAGEMIDKLTLKYNRTRQAVITRELIEIISGAAAL